MTHKYNSHIEMKASDIGKSIHGFLQFCYCYPYDIEMRFGETYGESLGKHFYDKFIDYTERHKNNFVGMIYMFGDMDHDNAKLFIEMIDKYYTRNKDEL